MTEWLDLMLEEIARKQREKKQAKDEMALRDQEDARESPDKPGQSK